MSGSTGDTSQHTADISQHTPVFVAGLHRSGTTALTTLLAVHPEVSGFGNTGAKEDEGQHIQRIYPSARAYGGAGRFAFDPRAHLTESSPLATRENAQRLFDQWRPYWDLSKRILVEKSPPNLVMMRFLQALYPNARFVVVTRHPIVVSLATSKWRGGTLLPLLDHWLVAHEIFRADGPEVTRLHVLTYEDLTANPRSTLCEVEQFLELSTALDSSSVDASRSNTYAERWAAMLTSSRRQDRRLVETIRQDYGPRMAAFGYDVEDVNKAGIAG